MRYARIFEQRVTLSGMSGDRVTTFPTKLDYYNTSSSGQYLCALLPVEARDIGVDEELGVEWCLEEDSHADVRYLKGVSTVEEGRLVRSVQPGRGSAAEFKVAIPPEFYKYDERSPFHGIEKGSDVILEVVEGADPHFRIYRTSDYEPRQMAVNPRIKAPVVAGMAYQGYNSLFEEGSQPQKPWDPSDWDLPYQLTMNVKENGDRVRDKSVKLDGYEKTTNSLGRARYAVAAGEYEAEASCNGKTITKTVVVSAEAVNERDSLSVYFDF